MDRHRRLGLLWARGALLGGLAADDLAGHEQRIAVRPGNAGDAAVSNWCACLLDRRPRAKTLDGFASASLMQQAPPSIKARPPAHCPVCRGLVTLGVRRTGVRQTGGSAADRLSGIRWQRGTARRTEKGIFPRTATARCIASGLRIRALLLRSRRCRQNQFKVLPANRGHPEDAWFAWLNERWEQIPPQKIVSDFAPDGQAYLFVLHVGDKTNWAASGYDVVICFVRPRGGL